MALYLRDDRRVDWCPNSATERKRGSIINPGYRNEEKQFIGTVDSTTRVLKMVEQGKLTQEEFNKALDKNANHINIDPLLLLDLAEQNLQQRDPQKEA